MTSIIYSGTPTATQNLVPHNVGAGQLNTLEKLLNWGLSLELSLVGNRDLQLVNGDIPTKQITRNIFDAANGRQYAQYIVYLELDPNWQSDRSKKFWEFTLEATNAAGSTLFNSQ